MPTSQGETSQGEDVGTWEIAEDPETRKAYCE